MNLTLNSFIVSCYNQNVLRDTTHLVFVMRTLLFPGLLTLFLSSMLWKLTRTHDQDVDLWFSGQDVSSLIHV